VTIGSQVGRHCHIHATHTQLTKIKITVVVEYSFLQDSTTSKEKRILLGGDTSPNWGSKLVFSVIKINCEYSSVNVDLLVRFYVFLLCNVFDTDRHFQVLHVNP
jgi:hypothetical protein